MSVKQHLNFYTQEFKPPELPGSVKLLVKVFASIFLISFVLSLVMMGYSAHIQQSLESFQIERDRLNGELTGLSKRMPNRQVDSSLKERVDREKQLMAKRNKVIDYLENENLLAEKSFTAAVDQLSKQTINGIWLQRFRIMNGGSDVELYGVTKKPNLISDYLTQLSERTAYEGRAFRQIQMNYLDEERISEFFLSTQEPQEPKEESDKHKKIVDLL